MHFVEIKSNRNVYNWSPLKCLRHFYGLDRSADTKIILISLNTSTLIYMLKNWSKFERVSKKQTTNYRTHAIQGRHDFMYRSSTKQDCLPGIEKTYQPPHYSICQHILNARFSSSSILQPVFPYLSLELAACVRILGCR